MLSSFIEEVIIDKAIIKQDQKTIGKINFEKNGYIVTLTMLKLKCKFYTKEPLGDLWWLGQKNVMREAIIYLVVDMLLKW